ncbi:MAG: SAM-dependent methyltransferase, partial [bacterium]
MSVRRHPVTQGSAAGPSMPVACAAAGMPRSRQRRACLSLLASAALLPGAARAQERFSLFVGSPQFTVDRMVKLAQLRDDDLVVDLGSGDGRIVLTAL